MFSTNTCYTACHFHFDPISLPVDSAWQESAPSSSVITTCRIFILAPVNIVSVCVGWSSMASGPNFVQNRAGSTWLLYAWILRGFKGAGLLNVLSFLLAFLDDYDNSTILQLHAVAFWCMSILVLPSFKLRTTSTQAEVAGLSSAVKICWVHTRPCSL